MVQKNRITRKQYNKEINEAIVRIEKGNFVTHKAALKELPKWTVKNQYVRLQKNDA